MDFVNGSLFCSINYSKGVTDRYTKIAVLMVLHGVPVFGGLIVTFFGYLLAIRNVRELSKDFVSQMEISVYKLLWYPAVLFITFMPGLIDNLVVIYTSGSVPLGFQVCHLVLTHSIGFTNALVYGFQRRLYHSRKKASDDNSVYKNDLLTGSITKDLVTAGVDDF